MEFKNIKERQVYYVNFNPAKKGEFDNNHLAVVIKKNKDKKSAIVMPLTSKENGLGKNKILVDIPSLPSRLKGDKSYAVYDQVRTVNSGRFQEVYEDLGKNKIVEVNVDDKTYEDIIKFATLEIECRLTSEEKINFYNEKINDIYMEKIIELAYLIKNKGTNVNEEEINELRNKIKDILYNIKEYKFTDKHKEDGIENIILEVLERKEIELEKDVELI